MKGSNVFVKMKHYLPLSKCNVWEMQFLFHCVADNEGLQIRLEVHGERMMTMSPQRNRLLKTEEGASRQFARSSTIGRVKSLRRGSRS